MRSRIVVVLAALFAMLVVFASNARSDDINDLVNPGDLSHAHAKIEKDCSICHKAFERKAQSSMCSDCHKEIRTDLANRTGFHGRNPLVRQSECANCHAEHKGRDFNQVRMNPLLFDHAMTDYPLDGKHKPVPCSGCHPAGKKYSAAAQTCFSCHNKDQPHLGNLGNKCESCHNSTSWTKVAAFDHSKTEFALNGAHKKVGCIACHVGEQYKGVPKNCNACHTIQDVHLGKLGPKCEICHTENAWKPAKFDHAKFTRFPLLGSHEKAKCADCHGEQTTTKVSMACFDCHKKQDAHLGQLGKECGTCHKTTAWRQGVTFDHDLTSYPLIGMHIAVACEGCHATPAYKDTKTDCYSCHMKDDAHVGRFTRKCESCHAPAGWLPSKFDHDTQTKFKLTGTHKIVGCYGCHKDTNVQSAKLPVTCISCHKAQDVHKGAFGPDCARCHTASSFKTAIIKR